MNKTRVLCVGVNPAFDITLTVDGLDADRVNRVTGERRLAAGKAANVACALSLAGVEVGLTGLYGADTWDEWRSLFMARTRDVEQLPVITAGSTRQNITLLTGCSTVKINRAGDPVDTHSLEQLGEKISGWLRQEDIAVFTGSIPPGMNKADYLAMMQRAKNAGARLVVDTDALTRSELLQVRPWLYKPNAHELAGLCGAESWDDPALLAAAKQLTQKGVETVLLTLGERGLAAITREETVRVAAKNIKAVNTVGAGDAALAAYISAYISGGDITECAHAAAAAGERAVSTKH